MTTDAVANDRAAGLLRLDDDRRRTLAAAMEGLTNVLGYVVTRRMDLDANLVQQLVALRDTYIAGRWQVADEQAFWPAYHAFVAHIDLPVGELISAQRWIRGIAWGAALLSVAVLVVLVLQLSFWAGLDSTVRQIDSLEGEMLAARQLLLHLPPSEAVVAPSAATAPPALPATGPAVPTLAMAPLAVESKCIQLMALYKILSERVARERLFLLSKDLPVTAAMPDTADGCADSLNHSQAMRAYVMGNARILREARQNYVLPLLFGLLGTVAYLLRSLAGDVRANRLTVTGLVGAGIRIPLGMLAGLAIGWVKGDAAAGPFDQMTPWALAFLAGYSVELVFTAMDRIIGAFTGDRATALPPRDESPLPTAGDAQVSPTAASPGAPRLMAKLTPR